MQCSFRLNQHRSSLHSVAGMFYPVSYRANGVGGALSIAKVGSIAGPVIGGMLLSAHLPLQQLFLAAASPLVVVLLIPIPIDQNPWAQSRRPMDMMRQGWSTSLFQASQQ